MSLAKKLCIGIVAVICLLIVVIVVCCTMLFSLIRNSPPPRTIHVTFDGSRLSEDVLIKIIESRQSWSSASSEERVLKAGESYGYGTSSLTSFYMKWRASDLQGNLIDQGELDYDPDVAIGYPQYKFTVSPKQLLTSENGVPHPIERTDRPDD